MSQGATKEITSTAGYFPPLKCSSARAMTESGSVD